MIYGGIVCVNYEIKIGENLVVSVFFSLLF